MSRLTWTAYDVLGVRTDATPEEIKASWKSKVKELHPDVGGDPVLFDKVCRAYEELSRPTEEQEQTATPANEEQQVAGYDGFGIDFTDDIFTPCDGSTKQAWVDTMLTPPFGYQGTRAQWITATIKNRKKMYQGFSGKPPTSSTNKLPNPLRWLRKGSSNKVAVPAKLKVRYYLIGVISGLAAILLRISGVTYDLISPHYGQAIFLSQWSGRPALAQIPLHTTGAVIGGALLGLLMGRVWIKRSMRPRFSAFEKVILAVVLATVAFAGEFVVAGVATLPALSCIALYGLFAGRIRLPLPKITRKSKSLQTIK